MIALRARSANAAGAGADAVGVWAILRDDAKVPAALKDALSQATHADQLWREAVAALGEARRRVSAAEAALASFTAADPDAARATDASSTRAPVSAEAQRLQREVEAALPAQVSSSHGTCSMLGLLLVAVFELRFCTRHGGVSTTAGGCVARRRRAA